MFCRNFELVLNTVSRYDNIFSEEERKKMDDWCKLEISCKTLYARMFFRSIKIKLI